MSISSSGRWLTVATESKLLLFSNASSVPRATYSFADRCKRVQVCISDDGGTIALLRENRLYALHGRTLELRWMTEAANGDNAELVMATNGQTIVVWSDRVLAFAPDAALPLWMLPVTGRLSAAVSPDGVYIAIVRHGTKQQGSRLLLLSRLSNQLLWEYEANEANIEHLRFSTSGRYIAIIADQYYLFECSQSVPVMQHSSSGNLGFLGDYALLLGEQHVWTLNPEENQAIPFELPLSLSGQDLVLASNGLWLYAVEEGRIIRVIRLPGE